MTSRPSELYTQLLAQSRIFDVSNSKDFYKRIKNYLVWIKVDLFVVR